MWKALMKEPNQAKDALVLKSIPFNQKSTSFEPVKLTMETAKRAAPKSHLKPISVLLTFSQTRVWEHFL